MNVTNRFLYFIFHFLYVTLDFVIRIFLYRIVSTQNLMILYTRYIRFNISKVDITIVVLIRNQFRAINIPTEVIKYVWLRSVICFVFSIHPRTHTIHNLCTHTLNNRKI